MTLILSETDYGHLCQQCDVSLPDRLPSKSDGGMSYRLPAQLGQGHTVCYPLSPGIWLDFIDKEFVRPWSLKVSEHEHLVQLMLLVSGVVSYEDTYPTLGNGWSYFSGSGISRGYVANYGKTPRFQGINIHLTPDAIEPFIAERSPTLKQALFKADDWKNAWFPKVTPAVRAIVNEMMQCPFQGAIRRLYLQGKVFELLAIQLNDIFTDQEELGEACHSKNSTVECVYHARDILTNHLENPPLITDLAKQVGVSDRTLRRGFREVFGTTIIGYLTQQRMMQAKELLRTGNQTVAEVANKVGYTHLGHFAAAFRKQFGVSPKEWMG